MSALQELNVKQITDALACACERQVPITLTVRVENNWLNLFSRIFDLSEKHLLVAIPLADAGVAPHEFVPAEKAGLSFKLKHHKHLCTATVAGMADRVLSDGTPQKVLAICLPTHMQRLQRRAYFRAEVPASRIVRGSFWLGGREAEPRGTSPTTPVWSGRIANLSAGGFQLLVADDPISALETGDSVGVRLVFGAAQETVYADAQFRHLERIDGQLIMGFQFVGMALTSEGRDALRMISTKVGEFQHAAQQAAESV